jgi:hypothetical protein
MLERKKRRLGNAFPPVDLATRKASEGKGGNGKDVTETRRQLLQAAGGPGMWWKSQPGLQLTHGDAQRMCAHGKSC